MIDLSWSYLLTETAVMWPDCVLPCCTPFWYWGVYHSSFQPSFVGFIACSVSLIPLSYPSFFCSWCSKNTGVCADSTAVLMDPLARSPAARRSLSLTAITLVLERTAYWPFTSSGHFSFYFSVFIFHTSVCGHLLSAHCFVITLTSAVGVGFFPYRKSWNDNFSELFISPYMKTCIYYSKLLIVFLLWWSLKPIL